MRSRRYDGGQDNCRSEGTAESGRGWVVSARTRQKAWPNDMRRRGGHEKAGQSRGGEGHGAGQGKARQGRAGQGMGLGGIG